MVRYVSQRISRCLVVVAGVIVQQGKVDGLTCNPNSFLTPTCCRAPTGPGSKNPEKLPMLATASFDGSVRLWNVQDGSCIQVFSRHRDSVYSVAFSPSGNYLASGSLAGQLYIWNVMEGRHIKSFKGKGDIFEVAWNKEETRVAACFSSNVVCIIDFP
jgi:transducin (beta)-like 1